MKTKFIFALAALLMLGSASLKAQESNNSSTTYQEGDLNHDGEINVADITCLANLIMKIKNEQEEPKIDYSKQPFTIVAKDSPITVVWYGFYDGATESFVLSWSYDGGNTLEGTRFPCDIYGMTINPGERCCFYSDALVSLRTSTDGAGGRIRKIEVSGGSYAVEGNIMSLVHDKNFLNPSEIREIDCSGQRGYNYHNILAEYGGLFGEETNLISAENLILPSYVNSNCYREMFKGCTSLTKAPLLPAITLAKGCYQEMFSGCTSLNYIKCLATDISATDCTLDWLKDTSPAGTFVRCWLLYGWPRGESGIPTGWTVESAR